MADVSTARGTEVTDQVRQVPSPGRALGLWKVV